MKPNSFLPSKVLNIQRKKSNSNLLTVLLLRQGNHPAAPQSRQAKQKRKDTFSMTSNIQREISRNVPKDIPIRFSESTVPLFTAYGCVLMERDTGRSYIYTAVNLKDGRREVISRRPTPLTMSGVEAMAEKIRLSKVAGAGRLQADRPFGDKLALDNCRDMLAEVFNEILPQHGFNIRKEQISLANHILDAISSRHVSLAEAEVGTGKTLAYLTAAIIAKRGRLNGYYNMSLYTGTPYVEMAHMPIVIATSSIALQKALVTEHIPALSDILLEHGVIKTPLTAVIRKGREHYICYSRLRKEMD
jgi:ATP-dependent DNA helicase DinG